ncbi:MAG TPA: FG-GAP-like repeat-containing protein, partial [Algoriphagus sp.]|nr:FG-GAP-like repeat-containing protein [Algoriphagus sp.]
NTLGQGAMVKVFSEGKIQIQEQNLYRGFQSSVSPVLVFGLGESSRVDSVQVNWPGGKVSMIKEVAANQTLVISQSEAGKKAPSKSGKTETLLISAGKIASPKANEVNDFKRQPLLSFEISGNGKAMLVEDFNGDGNPDVFLGGGAGMSGRLFFGQSNGQFGKPDSTAFVAASQAEDSDAVSFDANGDGFTDLLVASGGMHQFNMGDAELQDRLYLNDGKGKFSLSPNSLPKDSFPTGSVLVIDFNGDGFSDLFVGGRVIPGQYPTSPGARIWIGDGKGNFTDQTAALAPDFKNLGMVTDSGLADLNGDGQSELILVGDAMPVTVFSKSSNSWQNVTSEYFETQQVGFWSDLLIGDWDKDGKPELFIGNHGKNSQLFASDTQPMELLYKDFDSNGSTDAILSYYIQGEKYPSPSRDEVLGQVLFLKKRYLDFKSFSEVKMDNLFTPEERKDTRSIFVNRLETSYFVLGQNGKFQTKPLPIEAQFSPVFAAASTDLNGDGNPDLVFGGNLFDTKLKFGRYDANHGAVLLGDGKGGFSTLPSVQSGVSIKGEMRKIEVLGEYLLFYTKDEGIHVLKRHLSKDSSQ